MVPQTDLEEKIAHLEGLIARAEDRVRTLEARAEPGAARLVHALTNRIRKHRRNLQQLLPRLADPTNQNDQLREQQSQVQQAKRDAPADPNGELPERQDQEPRKPASQQGVVAGQ